MYITIEATPNPHSLKFLPDCPVSNTPIHFISHTDAACSSLARKLLNIQGVEAVFFGANFITVTKQEHNSWEVLNSDIIKEVISHHFDAGFLAFDEEPINQTTQISLSEIEQQIIEFLEQKVRPAVAKDGGDIIYRDFQDGVVMLELRGACLGCPSSTLTLKQGIESMLKYYIPEVIAVEAVN